MTIRYLKISIAVMACALLNLNSACPPPAVDLNADERLAEIAQKMPREDVLKDREVAKKISSTRLYVSLTTSPTRIENLELVLRTIDLSLVERILLVLPETFRGETYTIPDHIRNFPKTKIIRVKKDMGPISKLLGAFDLDNISEGREVAETLVSSPDNFVITIDDDTGYPNGTISQLLKAGVLNGGAIGASANDVSYWDLDEKLGWPDSKRDGPACNSEPLSRCDVVEGFGGVIYSVRDVLVAMDDMLKLNTASKHCFTSDDFVISFALAKHNIKRYKLTNEFITIPLQYSYGFGADALHRGAGMEQEASLKNINSSKYGRCYEMAAKIFGKTDNPKKPSKSEEPFAEEENELPENDGLRKKS